MFLRKCTALLTLALLGSTLFGSTASALILRAEDEVFLDEYVTEDVYVAGGVITVQQDVEGDLLIAGGEVTVNGIIGGDLVVFGGNVLVNEVVKDDLRVVAGAIALNSQVEGDLVVIGGSADLNQDSVVQGDVISISGKTNLFGTVNKSVKGILGRLVIGGTVNGDVNVRVTEALVLLNSGHVVGNVQYFAPEKIEDHGGTIDGEISFNEILSSAEQVKEGIQGLFNRGYLLGKFWSYLSMMLIGLLLVGFFPNFLRRSADRMKNGFFKSLGVGFLVFVLGGVASLIAVFTVVGVQLAFIMMALLFVLGEIGRIAAGYWIGSLLIHDTLKKGDSKKKVFWVNFGVLALGVFILKVVSFIPVVGWIANFVMFVTGAGALVLVQRTTYRHLAKEKMV